MTMKLSRLLLIAAISTETFAQSTQAPTVNWALDRLDQRTGPMNGSYSYTTTGAGVHIYVVDSGIRTDHADFAGRITINADYVPGQPGGAGSDCYGHGTGVASVAAGSTYGVAKSAQIHVLRITGCTPDALGDSQRLISALQWLRTNHIKPAVVNISYNFDLTNSPPICQGGSCVPARALLEQAVIDVINAGVIVVTSAGNSPGPIGKFWKMSNYECQNSFPSYLPSCPCDTYYDSCTVIPSPPDEDNLPAMAAGVITVGATRQFSAGGFWDRRVKQTHWSVDVYAPGWYLTAASHTGPTATQYFSNTSAAAPVVTGVVARYLQSHPAATPAQVRSWVKWNATFQTLSHAPSWEAGVIYMSPTE